MPDLAGRLSVRPGAPLPYALHSTRQDWAPRVAAGCPASQLPQRLATLFTLCASAHRLTAERAVQTALNGRSPSPAMPQPGSSATSTPSPARPLRAATARDQILRIGHDWVRRMGHPGEADHALLSLRACPMWREGWTVDDRLAALPDWLAHHWLGQPAATWWAAWQADPVDFMRIWVHSVDTPVTRLLASLQPLLEGLAPAEAPLDILTPPAATLPRLAEDLIRIPGFALLPTWQGHPGETGPWTRRHTPWPDGASSINTGAGSGTPPRLDAWLRLTSRLVDLVRLALPDGDDLLDHGSLSLGDGRAVAWTEMARGLLIHTVRLDQTAEGPVIADCRVLAPTEWNFHPEGAAAQAIAALDIQDPSAPARAQALVAAFDPCVDVTLDVWKDAAHA